jgi:hypothetical protein
MWLVYGWISKIIAFVIWFWPKVIYLGKEVIYPQLQPDCTYVGPWALMQFASNNLVDAVQRWHIEWMA